MNNDIKGVEISALSTLSTREQNMCYQIHNLVFPIHLAFPFWNSTFTYSFNHQDLSFDPQNELESTILEASSHLVYSNSFNIRCAGVEVEGSQVTLNTQWVEYAHFIGTNRMLRKTGPDGITWRSKWGIDASANLQSIKLGNEMAAVATFILREENQRYLLLTQRGPDLHVYPNCLSTSVSGAMGGAEKWTDFSSGNQGYQPDPFLTIIRETKEELGVEVARDDVSLDALALQMLDMQMIFLMSGELSISRTELIKSWEESEDRMEIEEPIFVPLELDQILSFIVYKEWSPISAMSVLVTLFKEFGQEVVEQKLDEMTRV